MSFSSDVGYPPRGSRRIFKGKSGDRRGKSFGKTTTYSKLVQFSETDLVIEKVSDGSFTQPTPEKFDGAAFDAYAAATPVIKYIEYSGTLTIDGYYYNIAVDGTDLQPMSKEQYDEWNRAEKIVVTSHYGFTYEKPDDDSQTVSDVVAGNRLKWEGSKGRFYKVSYPDGRQAYISKHISQPETKWRASLKQDVESIIQTAYTMIGIPYLFCGRCDSIRRRNLRGGRRFHFCWQG